MDIVKILRDSIERVPLGEHSTGLRAIMRHAVSAVRHFDRTDEGDTDSFTDAIYRTNQVFEGSLKEAYRVLADEDPAKLTINEIESYFEKNDVVRTRVLTQLTRYRQDYRNPSTHDYKLDFDQNEALLAILSVCAFSKLLVDKIIQRLAYNSAKLSGQVDTNIQDGDVGALIDAICRFSLDFTKQADPDLGFYEFEGALAGGLTARGIEAKTAVSTSQSDTEWDILVEHEDLKFPIEVRNSTIRTSSNSPYAINFLTSRFDDQLICGGLAIIRSKSKTEYKLYRGIFESKKLFIISKFDLVQIKKIADGVSEIEILR